MWNVLKNDDPKYTKIANPEIPEDAEDKDKILQDFEVKKQAKFRKTNKNKENDLKYFK